VKPQQRVGRALAGGEAAEPQGRIARLTPGAGDAGEEPGAFSIAARRA